MSKQRHEDALLQGYRGPYFPESVCRISDLADPQHRGFNRYVIDQAMEMAGLPVKLFTPVTSDGYRWFVGINIGWDAVAITVPWAQDWDFADGSQFDRSPALYIGHGTLANADQLVRRFNATLDTYYEQAAGETSEYD